MEMRDDATPHAVSQPDNSGIAASSQCVFVGPNDEKQHASPGGTQATPAAVSNHTTDEPPKSAAKGPPLIVKLAVASLGMSTLFYVMLVIYLGASSNQSAYTQNLNIAVASFDAGPVGQAFQQFASAVPAGNGLPNFKVRSVHSMCIVHFASSVADPMYARTLQGPRPSTVAAPSSSSRRRRAATT